MRVLMLRYSSYWCPAVLDRSDSVYLVIDSSKASQDIPVDVLDRFERVYRISSYDSMEEISAVAADLLSTGIRIDKVASPNEHTQYAAGYIAELLGLDHFSEQIALNTRDKRLMRMRAGEAGLSVPRSHSLPNVGRPADVATVEAAVGFPLVLKPASGSGTRSTLLVRDRAELLGLLSDEDFRRDLKSQHLVAEEFVDGEEFHVDAVWRDGEPWLFCISRYFTPRLKLWLDGGLNGAVMLDREDHAELYAQVRDMHQKLNSAIGLTRGTTHFEVFREKVTGRLVLGEIASRPGGCNIPEVVAAQCGVDEREVWAHELLDGDLESLPLKPGRFRYNAWVNLVPEHPGTVTSMPVREELLHQENVVAVGLMPAVGDVVELHPATLGILLVVGADSEAEVLDAAARLTSTFRVRTG